MRPLNLNELLQAGVTPVSILAVVGQLLWLAVYWEAIRIGFRQKTYAIPMVSVGLNLIWELYFAFICPAAADCPTGSGCLCPDSVCYGLWMLRAWAVLDLIILYQLVRYGRSKQRHSDLRRFFYFFVGIILVLSYFGQTTFIQTFQDIDGVFSTWTIDFVLGALFLYWALTKVEGQSLLLAWTMLLGNVTFGASMFLGGQVEFSYVRFLLIATPALNILYIIFLSRLKKMEADGG